MTAEAWTVVLVVVATLIAWRRLRHGDQQSQAFQAAAQRMSQQAADEFVRTVARQSIGRWAMLALLALGGGMLAPQAFDLAPTFVAGVSARMAGSDDSAPVPMLHYYDPEEELRYEVEQSEACVLNGGPCHVTVCKDSEDGESCWEFDVRWRAR